MVGKKLLALLLDLTVSERRVLLNEAKKSRDKRHEELIRLISSKPQSPEEFTAILNKVGKNLAGPELPEEEQSLKKRRFVDFAIKEIEELKISNFLKSNAKLRSLVLSNVYDRKDTKDIMEGYLDNLGVTARKDKDLDLTNFYLSKSLEIKSQSQTAKSVDKWRELLEDKLQVVEARYTADKAELFDLASINFLDSGSDLKQLIEGNPDDTEVVLETETLAKASYKVAASRVNFLDRDRSLSSLDEAESIVESVEADSRKKLEVQRAIAYVRFVSGFHHGDQLESIIPLIDRVISIDRVLEKNDLKVLFYKSILDALSSEEGLALEELRGKVKEDSKYMVEFSEAIIALKGGDLRSAKRLLHEVSYSGNPYVASWARAGDIAINTVQGNDDLVRSLLQRANRHIDNNAHRVYSLNSSAIILDESARALGISVPTKRRKLEPSLTEITPVHKELLKILASAKQDKIAS